MDIIETKEFEKMMGFMGFDYKATERGYKITHKNIDVESEFTTSGYNLRECMRRLVNTDAYKETLL